MPQLIVMWPLLCIYTCLWLRVRNSKIFFLISQPKLRNRKIIFLFINQNICCGYSKEPPQWNGSFEHPKHHTGQCKRTGGCYNKLVVAFFNTSSGVKGKKKIYTCWLYDLFINLHLFYLWWHLAHRPPVTLQFMALPSNWGFNSWFGLQIQQSSGVLPWQVLFLV